jgi:hypothetical protein
MRHLKVTDLSHHPTPPKKKACLVSHPHIYSRKRLIIITKPRLVLPLRSIPITETQSFAKEKGIIQEMLLMLWLHWELRKYGSDLVA